MPHQPPLFGSAPGGAMVVVMMMVIEVNGDGVLEESLQKMELNLMNVTQLCDIDPMIDDLKVLGRCISLWKSHPVGRPNEVWALDMVFQDAQSGSSSKFSSSDIVPFNIEETPKSKGVAASERCSHQFMEMRKM
ncbi:hypothetical protein Tco_0659879 [Tanacetum coccineum]